ncbi:coiled-coil domain-containing protein 191 isoform X2 [Tachysurus fulvidraco]|uniref:coiled-coil domain-containing protein 191 isoform X2 n=1 Tax=Tachysurus fulvidraco TaxID=1234273 RepID=UPI001FF05BB5|nr:coiled-coil domain-containing protein 191 isoform X2 [Tachysurus fulvidraco]
MFPWKRFSKPGTQTSSKMRQTDGDISKWMKKVEMASEFAVSEVFSSQKPHAGKPKRTVALESTVQLQDHDDAYSEAQIILDDWMKKKLRQELEMDEEEEEQKTEEEPERLNYRNFHDVYSQLEPLDESFEVHHFLQDLMGTDLMDCETVQSLCQDTDMEKKRGLDPTATMEIRHKQVKERRSQRDAARKQQQREQEARREALEKAKQLESKEQRRRKQEARRQEELLQQEVVRLRREMQEKRSMEQKARKRGKETKEKQITVKKAVTPEPDVVTQRQRYREQEVEAKVRILNLQCMQKHFSIWYSVVLEKRVQVVKAAAFCDWKRQLRAWRVWTVLLWVRRRNRETERMEEELRLENRRCQLAQQSNRRRLLRRCLNDWRLWCRLEKDRKKLISQREETRRKMEALIDAAASGKLTKHNCTEPPITVQPENVNQSETTAQLAQAPVQRPTSAPSLPTLTDRTTAPPIQAWQMTRHHTVLSLAEVQVGRRLKGAPHCQSVEMPGGRFEHRHAAQQKTIAEQNRLLKEQQDIISELQERQKLLELKQEAEKVEQLTVQLKPSASQSVIKTSHRSKGASNESGTGRPAPKEHDSRLASRHPAVRAMEQRAQQRAERRREVVEMMKRRKEEKLAQIKAEEEESLRKEEEEKREAVEKRKEEKRLKKEMEIEKQMRKALEQKLFQKARDHYKRSLLLYRGMTPWRRLVEQSHANAQKAEAHHAQVLQRRCLLFWLHTTSEALAEKRRRADQLYEGILVCRALYGWKMFMYLQSELEVRAEHFYTIRTQRKAFKVLMDHAIQQKLDGWDRETKADEHSARRVLRRCFSAWRRLPEILQEERRREERRDRLRNKVAEILPDFRGSPLNAMWSLGSHN